MAQYRKKPVVIDAFRWTVGMLGTDAPEWMRDAIKIGSAVFEHTPEGRVLAIITEEGTMRANDGDWIIRGVNGELYPCKPDIFGKTYEPVGEEFVTCTYCNGSGLRPGSIVLTCLRCDGCGKVKAVGQ